MPAPPDFIEVYPDALPAQACAQIIEYFERSQQAEPGRIGGGYFPELKRSRDICISGRPQWKQVEDALNAAVFSGLLRYLRRYPHLLLAPLTIHWQPSDGGPGRRLTAEDIGAASDAFLTELLRLHLRPGTINLQHYAAGVGGYPYWHCELYPRDADAQTLHRHLLWTLYLNDGFEAGETEFLYQQRKVKPRTGSLLIAPTAFTHTHRGNRPQGGDKYIATSWILFRSAPELFGQQ